MVFVIKGVRIFIDNFNERELRAMTNDQILIFVILLVMMGMFLWDCWCYDIVVLVVLLVCVLGGLVDLVEVFFGFGHFVVVTVVCVLVLSSGLQISGAVDVLVRTVLFVGAGRMLSIVVLIGLGVVLSGFMNNVGVMVLFMSVVVLLFWVIRTSVI
jgi:hypothetical protein